MKISSYQSLIAFFQQYKVDFGLILLWFIYNRKESKKWRKHFLYDAEAALQIQPVIPNTRPACTTPSAGARNGLSALKSLLQFRLALKASFTKMYYNKALALFKSRFNVLQKRYFLPQEAQKHRVCINIWLLVKSFVSVILIRTAMDGFIGHH